MAQRVLVLHGPNLNLLGSREPNVYGNVTLAQVDERLHAVAAELGMAIETEQSNHEGVLVDRIQQAGRDGVEFVVINAGAYTHTSVALRDALSGTAIPFVEVHVSNVYKREPFRHHSYLSDQAVGVIAGLGPYGYEAALRFAAAH